MAKKKTKATKVRAHVEPPKKPKAQSLPGMEDHAIKSLDELAESYAALRDERMELTQREHDLKTTLMKTMKKLGRTHYKHGDHEITIVPGEDDCKVRILKAQDHDDDDVPEVDDVEVDNNDDESPQQTEERRQAVDAAED